MSEDRPNPQEIEALFCFLVAVLACRRQEICSLEDFKPCPIPHRFVVTPQSYLLTVRELVQTLTFKLNQAPEQLKHLPFFWALEWLGRFLREFLDRYLPTVNALEAGLPAGEATGQARMPAPDCFSELKQFAETKMKGIERRILELVCTHDGKYPLKDLAADAAIQWNAPYDDAFENARRRINAKLQKAKLPWRIQRQDNGAKLRYSPPRNTSKKA